MPKRLQIHIFGFPVQTLSLYLILTFWVPRAQRRQPEKTHLRSSLHYFPWQKLLIGCNVKCFSYHLLISFLCPLRDVIMGRKMSHQKRRGNFNSHSLISPVQLKNRRSFKSFSCIHFLVIRPQAEWRTYLICASYSSGHSASTK